MKNWLLVALDPGGTTGIAAVVYEAKRLADVPAVEDLVHVLKAYPDGEAKVPTGNVLFCKAGVIPCQDELLGSANIVRAVKVLQKEYAIPAKQVRVTLEQFIARPGNAGRVAKKEFGAATRVTAGVMYGLAVEAGLDVRKHVGTQTASNAKGVINNDRLRRWGFWGARGSGQTPHERDALRHLLLLIRRIQTGAVK